MSSNLNPDIAPRERKFLVMEAKGGPTVNETAYIGYLILYKVSWLFSLWIPR